MYTKAEIDYAIKHESIKTMTEEKFEEFKRIRSMVMNSLDEAWGRSGEDSYMFRVTVCGFAMEQLRKACNGELYNGEDIYISITDTDTAIPCDSVMVRAHATDGEVVFCGEHQISVSDVNPFDLLEILSLVKSGKWYKKEA